MLRSVRALTRRDGTWLNSWRYAIYGSAIDSAGSPPFELRYRWTGREFDRESGLYFHRTRFYSPTLMRFIQEDPAGWTGGPNLYAYGDGDPTTGRDPDGLSKNYDLQAQPTEEQRAMYACMGTTAGCGGGGNWRRGEAWRGMRWSDLATSLEQEDVWGSYRRAFEQRMQENPDLAGGLRPMDREEFFRAYDAVMLEIPERFAQERHGLDLSFRYGHYAVDNGMSGRWATSADEKGLGTVARHRTGRGTGIAWVNSYVVEDGRATWYVANIFVHEYLHMAEGYRDGRALDCRVEALVPNSAGRVRPCR